MTNDTALVAPEMPLVYRKLTYDLYMSFRKDGLSPLVIKAKRAELRLRLGMNITGLVSVVIGVIAFVVIDAILGKLLRRMSIAVSPDNILWIVSPSGETVKSLPFYTALRVIREHGWKLAGVEPIHILTRWEHLKAVFGRRMC